MRKLRSVYRRQTMRKDKNGEYYKVTDTSYFMGMKSTTIQVKISKQMNLDFSEDENTLKKSKDTAA